MLFFDHDNEGSQNGEKTCVSESFLLLYPLSVVFITGIPADCGEFMEVLL